MPSNPPGYAKHHYRKERLKIMKSLGCKCFICEGTVKLQIHHIKPIKGPRPSGTLSRLTEWRKNPDNLMLLCDSCHRKLHSKMR